MLTKIREETCGNCPHKRRQLSNTPKPCSWHPEELCKGSCDNIGITQEILDKIAGRTKINGRNGRDKN